jgi:hypothetical protein
MPRLDPEDFGDQELARIFMTPKLRDARLAEEVLTGRGVDFCIAVEPFGRTLFGLPRHGAIFYVAAEHADFCADVLNSAGLSGGIVAKDDEDD